MTPYGRTLPQRQEALVQRQRYVLVRCADGKVLAGGNDRAYLERNAARANETHPGSVRVESRAKAGGQ